MAVFFTGVESIATIVDAHSVTGIVSTCVSTAFVGALFAAFVAKPVSVGTKGVATTLSFTKAVDVLLEVSACLLGGGIIKGLEHFSPSRH